MSELDMHITFYVIVFYFYFFTLKTSLWVPSIAPMHSYKQEIKIPNIIKERKQG